MADSCHNYLDVPSCMPLAYPPGFGSLALFDRSSVGNRPNCESSKSQGTHAVAPKSERQTTTLDQK
jgi:hypothetical protein